MSPRNATAGIDASALPAGGSAESASSSYACMVCATDWSYRDVHNTGRCPGCGGGLVREPVDPAAP